MIARPHSDTGGRPVENKTIREQTAEFEVRAEAAFEPARPESGPEQVFDERPDQEAALADHRLVQRCLTGEVAAWEELYARFHRPLCTIVRCHLGPAGSDAKVVDELAARVWYALVANDGKLLGRYSPHRGARLISFLRRVAKDVIARHFRSQWWRLPWRLWP